ncbi:gliding motility protein GldC [Rapidithrix thailandica]|uniref:Gliding motility protein GldC n=1 Tax=Rapidithrix thailandica TaxID=413964 RepID=A0AAW9S932_9BACT
MKESEIRFKIELDDQKVPEKIFWQATDGASKGLEEAKAISVSIWDHSYKETLRIDLWGKDMPIHEMKRFYIDILGGLANSMRTATNDEFMANELDQLCDKFVQHLKEENKKGQ